LATAIAGVAVASPVLAQSAFHLPAVSGNVELASQVSSVAQRAVSDGVIEVKEISDAVRHVVASAPHGAATAAADLAGGPLVKKAAVTAVARAVTAVVAANSAAGAVTLHRDSASSPAVAAAVPNLQSVLGIPFLVADIPVDIAQSAFQALSDASFGLSGVLFGLGIGDGALVQDGINEIASSLPDNINQAVTNVTADVQAIADALGLNFDAADRDALTRVAKVADAKNQGAVAVAKKSPGTGAEDTTKPDTTKPDTTKGETTKPDATKGDTTEGADATKGETAKPDATKGETTKPDATKSDTTKGETKPDTTKPSNSSTAEHHTGAATVKDAGDKGATKAGTSAHNGHTPGAASHPGGTGAKHTSAAGAKKGGGAKGGK
jgi:hypothetical protein